jgi:hypothetical protein
MSGGRRDFAGGAARFGEPTYGRFALAVRFAVPGVELHAETHLSSGKASRRRQCDALDLRKDIVALLQLQKVPGSPRDPRQKLCS